jgi:hypothetical protein
MIPQAILTPAGKDFCMVIYDQHDPEPVVIIAEAKRPYFKVSYRNTDFYNNLKLSCSGKTRNS